MKNLLIICVTWGLILVFNVGAMEVSSSQQLASGESGNTYSGIAIGYNPADFTFIWNGKAFLGSGLADIVITGLYDSRCSDDSSKSYELVESENPRIMEIIEKEIKLSSSIYADPATRLTPNIMVATHLLKGNAIAEEGSVSINLRIEDRQGNVKAQAKVSGPEKSFFELMDEATRSLAYQMCKPEPNVQACPYLWDVTFRQSGTIDTNRCLGSGLSGSDAISTIDGYTYFPNVLIRPSALYELTWKEDEACESFRKNDIQNNYRAKSHGDTYQKVDGFDGMDVDAVYLRVLDIRKGEKKMIFEYGSVPIRIVLSKIAGFKNPEERSSFEVTERCNQTFTFSPIPVYGN